MRAHTYAHISMYEHTLSIKDVGQEMENRFGPAKHNSRHVTTSSATHILPVARPHPPTPPLVHGTTFVRIHRILHVPVPFSAHLTPYNEHSEILKNAQLPHALLQQHSLSDNPLKEATVHILMWAMYAALTGV